MSIALIVSIMATAVVYLPTNPSALPAPGLFGLGVPPVVLEAVNDIRKENGCNRPLRLNAKLSAAAERQARAMAEEDFFDHVMPDGTGLRERVSASGYRFSKATENIAAGQPDVETVLRAWMNSPPHRANILDCSVTELGVGYVFDPDDAPFKGDPSPQYSYWVQVFAQPLGR